MKKKVIIGLLSLFLVSFPANALALVCSCTFFFNSPDGSCTGSQNVDFDIPSELTMDSFYEKFNCTNIDFNNFFSLGSSYSITNEDTCTSINKDSINVIQSGVNFDYGLSCSYKEELSGADPQQMTPIVANPTQTTSPNDTKNSQINKNCVIKGDNCVPLENPLGTTVGVTEILGKVINSALGVMGSLALLVFVVGGFFWLTAGGREDHIKKGTETMVWAVIGIIVIFSSYGIIRLVLQGLGAEQTELKKLNNTDAQCQCKIDGNDPIGMSGPLYDSEQKCLSAIGNTDPAYIIGEGQGMIKSCVWK